MKKRILKFFVTLCATILLIISANTISVSARAVANTAYGGSISYYKFINTYPQFTKSITQLKKYEESRGFQLATFINNSQTRTIEFNYYENWNDKMILIDHEMLYYNADNLVTRSVNLEPRSDEWRELEYEYYPNGMMSKITSNGGYYLKMDEHGNIIEDNCNGYTYSSYTYGNNYILKNWIDASGNSGWDKQTDNGDGTFTHESSKGDYSVQDYSDFAGYEQYDSYIQRKPGYIPKTG